MNVIRKGKLRALVIENSGGQFLTTNLLLIDTESGETCNVGVNTSCYIDIGNYQQVVNLRNMSLTDYFIKLTKAQIQVVDGQMHINANYIICEG